MTEVNRAGRSCDAVSRRSASFHEATQKDGRFPREKPTDEETAPRVYTRLYVLIVTVLGFGLVSSCFILKVSREL